MPPTVVMFQSQIDLHKGAPFRAFRLANKVNARLTGRAVGFSSVTEDAGTDDVFPGGRAPSIARGNVVQIQILSFKNLSAILAGIVVAFENIMSGKFDLLLRKAIEEEQQNDPRHADFEGNGVDAFWMGLLLRKIMPFVEIERLE